MNSWNNQHVPTLPGAHRAPAVDVSGRGPPPPADAAQEGRRAGEAAAGVETVTSECGHLECNNENLIQFLIIPTLKKVYSCITIPCFIKFCFFLRHA